MFLKTWLKNISVSFVLILLLVTCKKENRCDCVKGTGANTTETRELPAFNEVMTQDKVDVHISQGATYSVRVEGGKQVIKLLKTTVKNNVLTITDDNRCDFMRSYKRKITVYITMPTLRRVWQDGVGTVYMDNQFVCDTFRYASSNSGDLHINVNANIVYGGLHGNGDVYMTGVIGENSMYAVGQGYYHGFDAVANKAILTLKTSGKVEVNVNSYFKIDMNARSTGDVYYKGYPTTIEKNVLGKGKLIAAN